MTVSYDTEDKNRWFWWVPDNSFSGLFRKRFYRPGKGLAAEGFEPRDSGRQPAAPLAANAGPHIAAL